MAQRMKRLERFRNTLAGQVLEALLYAAMLGLALLYFTGNGQFLYEV